MKILYVKNNSERSEEYQLKTIIFEENGNRYVKKEVIHQKAIPHLSRIKDNYDLLNETITNKKVKLATILFQDSKSIVFEYIAGKNFEQKYLKSPFNLESNLKDLLQHYIDFLHSSFEIGLISDMYFPMCQGNENKDVLKKIFKSSKGKELYFTGLTNVDLIFSNIIISNDIYYIIDYEWVIKESLPVNYVIFRALINSEYRKEFFHLFETKKIMEYRDLFENLEKIFQSGICKKDSFFKYKSNYLKKVFSRFETEQKLERLLQTRSWKITAPLRWIASKLKRN